MSKQSDNQGILDTEEKATSVPLTEREGSVELGYGARRRMLVTGASLLLLFSLPYLIPGLEAYRPYVRGGEYVPFWNLVGRELMGEGASLAQEQAEMLSMQRLAREKASEPLAPLTIGQDAGADARGIRAEVDHYPEYQHVSGDTEPPKGLIEHLEAMTYYYEKLTLTDLQRPSAITRAGHWGDSVLANDGITSGIRRRLQARFGDAGHGYHVLARYNLAYRHQGVRFKGWGQWRKCEIIFKCEPDAHYGYGGVSVSSSGGGTARWQTMESGFGSKVSRFELWYATLPYGGRFTVKIDGHLVQEINTRAPKLGDAWQRFEVEDGHHTFEVRAGGGGVSRGYGVVLERDVPGVVWDGLALVGSFTQRLDYQDPEHIARHIRRRNSDLLVFMFGGNDVQREKTDLYRTMVPYEDEYRRVLKKFRAGKPEASCLVMSLVDHGERLANNTIRTRRIVPRLVASQRQVAFEVGCAFFDTYEAMGGSGSMARWYRARPQLGGPDLGHPTTEGHEAIAAMLYRALMRGYAEFRTQRVGQPLPSFGGSQGMPQFGPPDAAVP